MAVNIKTETKAVKAKATPKIKTRSSIAEKVDTYVDLDFKINGVLAELADAMKERDMLAKELKDATESEDPAENIVLQGKKHVVELSAKARTTTLEDKEAAIAMLEGIDPMLPFKIAKFGIGDLKKYLTDEQVQGITKSERKRARVLKVIK